jgi:aspartate/tyrosine/aromatic aminotransferase
MFFSDVELAPPDPILGLKQAYLGDPRTQKVDLGVGIYKTTDLKAPMMACVKEAEKIVYAKEIVGDYLAIDGDPGFVEEMGKLIFGSFYSTHSKRIYGAQAVGGTGALRICGEFLAYLGLKKIFISDPTWTNHLYIFDQAGIAVERYPYYSKEKKGLDFPKMHGFLSKLDKGSVVIFHASCHNPSGCDPTEDEWKELAALFVKKGLLPFFDLSYQGLGDGLDQDAASIRIFAEVCPEMVVVTTCAKNFSLYAQRTGALYIQMKEEKSRASVASQVKKLIRPIYSNPPGHGALIAKEILTSPKLKEEWKKELNAMRKRISEMRDALVDLLKQKPCAVDYEFMRKHKGMFSFCNLEKSKVDLLKEKFGIYLTNEGRINVAGLNRENLEYVADAILEVSR